jgi:hypothetical protein
MARRRGGLRSTPVSQAMVFVTLGLLVGNRALELFGVGADTPVIRHLAEATLTLGCPVTPSRVNGQAAA